MKMIEKFKEVNCFYAENRRIWRKWLIKNHGIEKSIWLIIYHKKCNTKSIYYNEAVEEALCFGWIDSVKYKRNDESAYQLFTPRKSNSNWSELNKIRVDKMIAAGAMTEAGKKLIDFAKANGNWNVSNEIGIDSIPKYLDDLFQKNEKAKTNFESFSTSAKKLILTWIHNAKKDETKRKRIELTVKAASENTKSFP